VIKEYGADVLLPVKFKYNALLTLMLALILPAEKAKEMAQTLLALGATSAQADINGFTAFHRYVEANAEALLESLWETDPAGAKTAINHMSFVNSNTCETPLQLAAKNGNLALVLKLLEQGAVTHIDFESWYVSCDHGPHSLLCASWEFRFSDGRRSFFRRPKTNLMTTRLKSAKQSVNIQNRLDTYESNQKQYKRMVHQPLILALESAHPETAIGILEHGADPNVVTAQSATYMQEYYYGQFTGESALDLADKHLAALRGYKGDTAISTAPVLPEGMDIFLSKFEEGTYQHWAVSEDIKWRRKTYEEDLKKHEKAKTSHGNLRGVEEKKAAIAEAITTMEKVREILLAKGAKTFLEIHPEFKDRAEIPRRRDSTSNARDTAEPFKYDFSFRGVNDVTEARKHAYLKL
jgi:ankyrin repeat protein